jgi:hypothetical protein
MTHTNTNEIMSATVIVLLPLTAIIEAEAPIATTTSEASVHAGVANHDDLLIQARARQVGSWRRPLVMRVQSAFILADEYRGSAASASGSSTSECNGVPTRC